MYLLVVILVCAVYALLDRNINMLIAVGIAFGFWLIDFFVGNFQIKPFGQRGNQTEKPRPRPMSASTSASKPAARRPGTPPPR